MDDKFKLYMARIETVASNVDPKHRDTFLDLTSRFADGIANMDVLGPDPEPTAPINIPFKGARLNVSYSPAKVILGQEPEPPQVTSVQCPNCHHVLTVTLQK